MSFAPTWTCPGTGPPMSIWWMVEPTQPMSSPSKWIAPSTTTSIWCCAPAYGSLQRNMSSGRMPGFSAHVATTSFASVSIEIACTSMYGAITRESPRAVMIEAFMSWTSLAMSEPETRSRVFAASSLMLQRRCRRISNVIGSTRIADHSILLGHGGVAIGPDLVRLVEPEVPREPEIEMRLTLRDRACHEEERGHVLLAHPGRPPRDVHVEGEREADGVGADRVRGLVVDDVLDEIPVRAHVDVRVDRLGPVAEHARMDPREVGVVHDVLDRARRVRFPAVLGPDRSEVRTLGLGPFGDRLARLLERDPHEAVALVGVERVDARLRRDGTARRQRGDARA